ncbi:hypothetical protein DXG01_013782 [Tephrocybe rancida]|nr:hypothetical protein DXG01_013782 [Tephrocybe rancida]
MAMQTKDQEQADATFATETQPVVRTKEHAEAIARLSKMMEEPEEDFDERHAALVEDAIRENTVEAWVSVEISRTNEEGWRAWCETMERFEREMDERLVRFERRMACLDVGCGCLSGEEPEEEAKLDVCIKERETAATVDKWIAIPGDKYNKLYTLLMALSPSKA